MFISEVKHSLNHFRIYLNC